MDFKKVTFLAFLGSLLMLFPSILWTLSSIISSWDYKLFGLIPSPLPSVVSLIGQIFIVIFFYALYEKQD